MKLCPQCETGFPDHAETCPTHGGMLSEIIDLKPGMLIRGTYRIVHKLGEGGFGAVYLAHQILMKDDRALKFLSRQWSGDKELTARFRHEVRTLRQLRHRNVVDCGDLEQAEDHTLFFSMEYVDGPNLRDFFASAPRPFDVRQALAITRGIAEGLGVAHSKDMVHRDIKPENILMARDQHGYVPKIADFGIVATKERSTAFSKTRGTLLTMDYAAPEQWRGMPAAELDGRTDFYALGGVLFEMLTSRTVFQADSYEGWAEQHLKTAPIPPSSLRADLSDWKGLDELVMRLLAKDREKRPGDLAEVLGLMDAIQHIAPKERQRTVPEQPEARAATIIEQIVVPLSKPSYPAPKRGAGLSYESALLNSKAANDWGWLVGGGLGAAAGGAILWVVPYSVPDWIVMVVLALAFFIGGIGLVGYRLSRDED